MNERILVMRARLSARTRALAKKIELHEKVLSSVEGDIGDISKDIERLEKSLSLLKKQAEDLKDHIKDMTLLKEELQYISDNLGVEEE